MGTSEAAGLLVNMLFLDHIISSSIVNLSIECAKHPLDIRIAVVNFASGTVAFPGWTFKFIFTDNARESHNSEPFRQCIQCHEKTAS